MFNTRTKKRADVDMTTGSAFKHILLFAVPLLLGNLFQQFYAMVDTWVVGNFVSNEAFSAVGTVGPIVNMLIGAFAGLSTGASVVVAQFYGAKQEDKVHDAVHTAVALTVILSVAFTVLGIAMTPFMLRMMKTPEEVFPESSTYLFIYFGGMAGMLFYNMGSGILRAVGDSRHPFVFLVVSAVLNIVLDLVFVIVFKMGVAGVAIATVISQVVSAVLTMGTLLTTTMSIRVRIRDIRLHGEMLVKTLQVGIPASLQMAVTSFSNVFVQGYINQFGADCMSGWTAYGKIDQFIFLPMQSLGLAVTTFVGQNLGRGQVERARKSTFTTLLMAFVSTVVISAAVMIFAPVLVRFFNKKPEVVDYGTLFLYRLTPFYITCCINQVYTGALRGAGDSRAPMIIMLVSFVVFRQIYLFVVSTFVSNTILPIAMGYPAGWIVCSVLTFVYFMRADFGRHTVVEGKENAGTV